jgi:hypothetical protein
MKKLAKEEGDGQGELGRARDAKFLRAAAATYERLQEWHSLNLDTGFGEKDALCTGHPLTIFGGHTKTCLSLPTLIFLFMHIRLRRWSTATGTSITILLDSVLAHIEQPTDPLLPRC